VVELVIMETVKPRTEVLIRYVKLAEGLASQTTDGLLPSVTWLKGNGYTGLYQYMRAHPSEFSHLRQLRLGARSHDEKVRKRRVALANKLAYENGGMLPTVTWLTTHGYSGLLSYIWKHPDFFRNIQRDASKKMPQEHVAAAEALARRYGGKLPGSWTIVNKSGGWALYRFMRRNPDLFVHIRGAPKPEKRNGTTSEGHEKKYRASRENIKSK